VSEREVSSGYGPTHVASSSDPRSGSGERALYQCRSIVRIEYCACLSSPNRYRLGRSCESDFLWRRGRETRDRALLRVASRHCGDAPTPPREHALYDSTQNMITLTLSIGLLVPDALQSTTRRNALKTVVGSGLSSAILPTTAAVASEAAPAPSTAASKLVLPRLGLGAWAWGDTLFWGYDEKKDGELQEVFDYAVDKGITFFDTAEVYGLGRSEQLLGQFAARNPNGDQIQVATKFAALPWRTKPGDVLEAAKRSTDRLGRPIDLYQIHFPNAWANEAYWDGLGDCVDRGLIKAAGVSNYGVEALRACHAKLQSRGIPLSSNQIQLSLIYPFALSNGLVDACKELDVGVLAYSPIGLGLLAGKFSLPDKLPDGPRKLIAQQLLADPNFDALLATMRSVGQGYDSATPAQVAIAWCTAKGACAIPGARNLRQAESNIAAAGIRLSATDVQLLDAAAAKVKPAISPEKSPFPKTDVFTGMRMFDS
jgi:pyridoxine 4-dehydrogenase